MQIMEPYKVGMEFIRPLQKLYCWTFRTKPTFIKQTCTKRMKSNVHVCTDSYGVMPPPIRYNVCPSIGNFACMPFCCQLIS